jgi:sec-independent protein translocase protein TatA
MKMNSVLPLFLISMPGGMEWLWIILAVVLLFGGRKIPELAKGIGKGIREFKSAKDGVIQEINSGSEKEDVLKKEKDKTLIS